MFSKWENRVFLVEIIFLYMVNGFHVVARCMTLKENTLKCTYIFKDYINLTIFTSCKKLLINFQLYQEAL